MRNDKKLGIFGGNDRLLDAIIDLQHPQTETTQDHEVQREAKRISEKESELRWTDRPFVRKHKADQHPMRYNGRKNAKRKGLIRNNVEARILARIK